MGYADAARAVTTYIGSTDSPTLPLNSLLLARAGEALAPISASQDGRSFGIGAKRLVSVADFYAIARIPGVQFQQLTAEAPATFVVDATDPPAVLLSAFNAAKLGDLIGDNNVAVLRTLRDAWDTRIRGTGFWTDDQVNLAMAVIDGGVLCFPVEARALKNRNPSLSAELLSPPVSGDDNQARYEKICAIFHDAIMQYDAKNLAAAAAAVDASNRNADLWATLQKVAETIRDAPSNIALGAGGYVAGALWDTLKGNWPLVLGLAAVGCLWLFRGRVAKAAFKAGGTKL